MRTRTHLRPSNYRGENVEEAFLKTAKLIFQSVQDGRYA
jgi:hypothetical protein